MTKNTEFFLFRDVHRSHDPAASRQLSRKPSEHINSPVAYPELVSGGGSKTRKF